MNLQRYKQKQMSTDKKIYLLHSSHKPIVHNINNYLFHNSSLKFDIKAKQFYAASQRVL